MYEPLTSPLAGKKAFQQRVYKSGGLALLIFLTSLTIGISGYHFIADMDWVDAFLNASMILGGMGEISTLHTSAAKIFAGCYALFSGVTFLSSMAIFLSPVIHRILHKLHVNATVEE